VSSINFKGYANVFVLTTFLNTENFSIIIVNFYTFLDNKLTFWELNNKSLYF